MYCIQFYVPESHLSAVKDAMFAAGAGQIGSYDSCAWQTKGQGQYRPLEGSIPFQGSHGVIETVEEWKVELVCEDARLKDVIHALKKAHPYQTPAYFVWRGEDF